MKPLYAILLVTLLYSCTKDTNNQVNNGTFHVTLTKYKSVVMPVRMFTSTGEVTDTQTLNKFVMDSKTIDYINSDSSHFNYNKIVFLGNDTAQLVSPSGYKDGLRYSNNTDNLFKFYNTAHLYDSSVTQGTYGKTFTFDSVNVIKNGINHSYFVSRIGRGNYQNLNIPITWLMYRNVNGLLFQILSNNEYNESFTSSLVGAEKVILWQTINSYR